MIILDTNILRSFELVSPKAELLRTIREAGGEGVSVPWAALEELAGQRTHTYLRAHERATAAVRAVNKSAPIGTPSAIAPLDYERVLEYWRRKYLEIVDVIPTSATALQEATMREAAVLPPCKAVEITNEDGKVTRTVKTGGRDTAIWLSAIEYAREHEDETVYFVSDNHKDFGRGGSYEYPMNVDVEGLGNRFVHLMKLEDVLPKFAEKVEVAEDALDLTLRSQENLQAIAHEARFGTPLRPSRHRTGWQRFQCTRLDEPTGERLPDVVAETWLGDPNVSFSSVRDAETYRIGEHVWCTAWATWLLSGHAALLDTCDLIEVGCAWETRVLFSLTPTDSRKLTVLRSNAPRACTPQEADNVPEVDGFVVPQQLAELDERIRRSRMRRALRRYTTPPGSVEEVLVQLLDRLPAPVRGEITMWPEDDVE
ncbi:PIN domain-containing protein [Streptomyces sp. NPDC057020]|uniref:PIN domain-containing protein n=1 Tax=unclassified Streptomyces TaxID=2593676 RepID=UPI0036373309